MDNQELLTFFLSKRIEELKINTRVIIVKNDTEFVEAKKLSLKMVDFLDDSVDAVITVQALILSAEAILNTMELENK